MNNKVIKDFYGNIHTLQNIKTFILYYVNKLKLHISTFV